MKRAWIIRRNEEAVSPVIATILMVAITVVLAAVLYVMVSGLIGGTTASEPNVTMGAPESISTTQWKVKIAGVSEAKGLGSYKAVLFKNGTEDSALDPVAEGTSGNIAFEDAGDEGSLTSGDYFLLTCSPASQYELSILWKDSGNERGSSDWES